MTTNSSISQTPEAVALALMEKCLQGMPTPIGKKIVLDTYAECLLTIKFPSKVSQS